MASFTDARIGNFERNQNCPVENYNTAEYLSWRRLHLSKSKLNNVTEMASFMSGFAILSILTVATVATVELQINDDDVRPPLLIAFAITTSLLVGSCFTAIIIATCVLPHLESVAKTATISEANQSPHDKMMRFIDISWILTNSASLFFFTLDIILMCWIKYTVFSIGASIAATVIMTPVLFIILAFAVLFYRRIVKHQYVISNLKYEELERMHKQLETAESLCSMSYQGTVTSNYQGTPTSPPNRQWLHQQPQQQHLRPPQIFNGTPPSRSPNFPHAEHFSFGPATHIDRRIMTGPLEPDPPSPTLPHSPNKSPPSSVHNV